RAGPGRSCLLRSAPVQAMDSDHSLQDERQEREDLLAQAHEEQTRHPAGGAGVLRHLLPIRQVLLPVIQLAGALLEDIPDWVTVVAVLQRSVGVQQQALIGERTG